MEIKQFHIVLVNLDPTVGSEIRKKGPCIVISPDEMNRHLMTLIIAPVTSRSKKYPTRLKVRTGNKEFPGCFNTAFADFFPVVFLFLFFLSRMQRDLMN